MSNWQDKNYQAFYFQRKNAVRRRIRWNLTFQHWLDIWNKSGKLAQRGRGQGKYCMARFKDRGAYAIGNVEIITFSKNNHDANIKRVRTERNRRNIAKGIKDYWGDLTLEDRTERGKQISEGLIASGSQKKAWANNPRRRRLTSRRTKQWWAELTEKERKTVGRKISQAVNNDRVRKIKSRAIYARDYSGTVRHQVLILIQSNPGLTNRQIELKLGANSGVRQALRCWKTRGLIERKNYLGKKGRPRNELSGGQWFPIGGATWP